MTALGIVGGLILGNIIFGAYIFGPPTFTSILVGTLIVPDLQSQVSHANVLCANMAPKTK